MLRRDEKEGMCLRGGAVIYPADKNQVSWLMKFEVRSQDPRMEDTLNFQRFFVCFCIYPHLAHDSPFPWLAGRAGK